MSDPHRPTQPRVEMHDNAIDPAQPGSRVLGLTIGGVLVPTVVTNIFGDSFDAWTPYPTIPDSVKQRQLRRFT